MNLLKEKAKELLKLDYSVNKVAEATFNMPARNITIEYHFESSANILYSHSYWLGYIGDKDLNVTYSGKDS